MKYKVGDRVRIKSLDWYNENKDKYGSIYAGSGFCFWKNMVRHCGEIMKITSVKVDPEDSNKGFYFMENSDEKWTDGMIEGLVEEEIEKKLSDESWRYKNIFDNLQYPQSFECPEGYIFKDENGDVINATKIVLEKKKKEYPKTYEECCKIMQVARHTIWFDYDDVSSISEEGDEYECHIENTLCAFRKLLICRDAYWKIAGDEMGLGKPWEPDWTNDNAKYSIYTIKGVLTKAISCYDGAIFVFPTEEMRDTFKKNFDPDIKKM